MVHEERLRRETLARVERGLRRDAQLATLLRQSLWHGHQRPSSQSQLPPPQLLDELRRAVVGGTGHEQRCLARELVECYLGEIAGRFDVGFYRGVTRVLPALLSLVLGESASVEGPALAQRLDIRGDVERLQRLEQFGTLVIVPTHVSNLDSALLGYAVYRMGLQPVLYGAGLNLFSNPVVGFFLAHLGAYSVDRQQGDPLYRETLKAYTVAALRAGQSILFFPAGTRSRSGVVEQRLKLGLLGCSIAAWREGFENGARRPRIFIVPVTLSYPLVLEAQMLVEQHLSRVRGDRHLVTRDESMLWQRWLAFVRGLSAPALRIHLTIGEPLDPLANRLDGCGRSIDPQGRPIDPTGYFRVAGRFTTDRARDEEYTRHLGRALSDRYRRDTVVTRTTLVAGALCAAAAEQRPRRMPLVAWLDAGWPALSVSMVVARLSQGLRALRERVRDGAVRADGVILDAPPEKLLQQALAAFAVYHREPVAERRADRIVVHAPKLIYYYRNRLSFLRLFEGDA